MLWSTLVVPPSDTTSFVSKIAHENNFERRYSQRPTCGLAPTFLINSGTSVPTINGKKFTTIQRIALWLTIFE